MNGKLLIVMILLLRFSQSFSQSIEGTVQSEEGMAIPFANVAILNSTKGTVTDSNGYFSLQISNGSYRVVASCIGFATITQNVTVTENQLSSIRFILKENTISLDEVVVSADKRDETLVKTELSMTSLSSEKIKETRTWDLSNLTGIVPNYQYGNVGVGYQQMIAMRGVSVFSENPSVATYVDGVNSLDISANGFQFMDIERIEILRGPQGTLYGRNAMGGVINIITKKPTNRTSGFGEISTGNQGLYRASFALRKPLVKDKLFFGLSAQLQRQNGFYTNDTSQPYTFLGNTFKGPADVGVRFGDEDSYYGNLFLRWLPSKNLDILLNSKAQEDKSIGASSYYQASENDSIAFANPYKFTVNRFGSNSRKIFNNSVAVNYYHSKFTLSSTSAYQYILQAYNNVDFDYWSYDAAWAASYYNKVGQAYPQRVASQEIRFSSPINSKRLKWTLGTYFFSQIYKQRSATVYESLADLFGIAQGVEVSQRDLNNSGLAFFGQATYRISPKFDFTLGLRSDYENRRATIALFRVDEVGNRNYSKPETDRQKSFQALSPKAVVSYHAADNQNIYASYNRGFRAGGINMFIQLPGYETYAPEYSDNYELGYKFSSKNKRLLFTSTLFFMNWQNLQLEHRPDGKSWITANIGDVHSKGVEVEVSFIAIKNLHLDYSLGVNDARYQSFEYLGKNIRGNQTIMAPKATMFLGAQYEIPFAKKYKGIVRGEWRYIGDQYFDLVNKVKQNAYSLFNTRAGVKSRYVEVFFWVQNIFDERYITYTTPAVFRQTLLNRPRSFGVTLTRNF